MAASINIQSRWRGGEDDGADVAWARSTFDAVTPHATGGTYVNFLTGDETTDPVRAAYGDRVYERLAAIKADWDPENLFHLNQNVQPTRSG